MFRSLLLRHLAAVLCFCVYMYAFLLLLSACLFVLLCLAFNGFFVAFSFSSFVNTTKSRSTCILSSPFRFFSFISISSYINIASVVSVSKLSTIKRSVRILVSIFCASTKSNRFWQMFYVWALYALF